MAPTAVLAVLLAFGAGYWIGDRGATRLQTYTADGYVGADQASFQVGDTTYGFESSVAWRDQTGSEHQAGWPQCLSKLQPVEDVRFAAGVLWYGDSGIARVVWVDCEQ